MKKFFSLENLILLTIFLLPVYLVKVNFFGIPSNLLEALIVLVLLVWIFRKNKKIILILSENRAVFASVGIIFLGLVISTFLNPDYKTELGIMKGWFLLPFLFAFVAQDVFAREKWKNIFEAYFYSTLAVAIIALIYFFLGKITFDGRLEAFFNSPNYLTMYLAPGFIFGIFNYKKENLRNNLFYIISLAIIGAVIYLTKSYAGWPSLFLAILITSLLIYRKKSKKYLFLGILLFLTVIFFQFQTSKFGDLVNIDERSSFSSRIIIWKSAGKIIADNWFWGIGPGNFQHKYLEYQKYYPPYLEWAVPHPHNLYLAFWLSGGVLGILGFLGLIFFWIKSFLRKENKAEYFWIFGILLYILIHGFFDTTYFKNDLAVVFWLVILAGINLKENKRNL